MENLQISDWGIAVAALIFVVKELFRLINGIIARKNGEPGEVSNAEILQEMHRVRLEYLRPIRRQSADLHDWHNVNDQDGVKIWYVRPSLAEAVVSLSDNIAQQTKILENIARITKETLETIK